MQALLCELWVWKMPGHSLLVWAETQQAHEKVQGPPDRLDEGRPHSSNGKSISPSSSKKKKHKKKSHGNSQPDSQKKLQGDSQTTSQKDSQMSLQTSLCWSVCQVKKDPSAVPLQKKHSRALASTQVSCA